jgi:hypothetical protein
LKSHFRVCYLGSRNVVGGHPLAASFGPTLIVARPGLRPSGAFVFGGRNEKRPIGD